MHIRYSNVAEVAPAVILSIVYLFSVGAPQVMAQTASFTLSATVQNNALRDLEQYRLTMQPAPMSLKGAVAASVGIDDTTVTVTGTCPASGVAWRIDAEPFLTTGTGTSDGSGNQVCPVTRNAASPAIGATIAGTTAASHSIGAVVYELLYPNVGAMITHRKRLGESMNLFAAQSLCSWVARFPRGATTYLRVATPTPFFLRLVVK